MSSKSMKPSPAKPREMTEEEKQQQILRAFMQERKALIQGIAFNAAGNPSVTTDTTQESFAEWVVKAADALSLLSDTISAALLFIHEALGWLLDKITPR